jgi:GT2 family glycosyltransferase
MAVAIVNYNTREDLRACLETVRGEGPGEVVVVDNASSDGSAEMIQAEYPRVMLHCNKTNVGFGTAANQAVAKCSANYVLLLNSDILLQAGAVNALSNYIDVHPRAAIVGPRLVNTNGTLQASCYPFPTILNTFFVDTCLGDLIRYVPVLRNHFLPTWPHHHAKIVPWVKGAAMAIRREAFETVGGFDETFFMYSEEIDLCYRLLAIGWQVHFAPVTTAVHPGGASTAQHQTEMAVQLLASTFKFYRKHYSGIRLVAMNMLLKNIVQYRWIRDTLRLHVASDKCKKAKIKADVAAWQAMLPKAWSARRKMAGQPRQ